MNEEQRKCPAIVSLSANGWRISLFCNREPFHDDNHCGSVVSGEPVFAPGTTVVEWT
jgi:hypothetical protein